MKSTYLSYDKNKLEMRIPDHWAVLTPCDPPVISGLKEKISESLANPIGTDSLLTIASQRDKSKPAVIVVSDITRPVPNKDFLPYILDVLQSAGYSKSGITILIATGMHVPSTVSQRIELLGADIVGNFRIVDHDAKDPSSVVKLPSSTSSGAVVSINADYYHAGLRILTGFIEPHFMAGFSGGRKSICPGIVDLRTLRNFHGSEIMGSPLSRMGKLKGNPCHRESLEVANMLRPDFIFNVTINSESRITGIFAGDMEEAHERGVRFIRETMTVAVESPFDVVLTSGGGYPLDTTFYQSVKGMVAAGLYVRAGGKIIVASSCRGGIGSDSYRKIMARYDDYKVFLRDISSSDETELDQWEFQLHTRVIGKTGYDNLIVITDGISASELRRCHVTPAEDVTGENDVEVQLRKIVDSLKNSKEKIAVIPRGPYILPVCISQDNY